MAPAFRQTCMRPVGRKTPALSLAATASPPAAEFPCRSLAMRICEPGRTLSEVSFDPYRSNNGVYAWPSSSAPGWVMLTASTKGANASGHRTILIWSHRKKSSWTPSKRLFFSFHFANGARRMRTPKCLRAPSAVTQPILSLGLLYQSPRCSHKSGPSLLAIRVATA